MSRYSHYILQDGMYSPRRRQKKLSPLPAGVYSLRLDDARNMYFKPEDVLSDELIALPDTICEAVYADALQFWKGDMRAQFEKYGLIYKRGILLYGNPGTGKTCLIVRLMQKIVEDGGIVLFNSHQDLIPMAVKQLRQVEGDRKVLVVFEEFEGICHQSGFLSLLDGQSQINNVVYVATTNYIDKVPDKVKNRPSRFAKVIEVGAPSFEARRTYLNHKLKGITPTEITEWLRVTEGFVIDQIKDLIVSVMCFQIPLPDAAKKIRKMNALSEAPSMESFAEQYGRLMARAIETTRSLLSKDKPAGLASMAKVELQN